MLIPPYLSFLGLSFCRRFQVYPDLKKYKGGVYHYTGLTPEQHSESLLDPLEVIDHAVVAVGYGCLLYTSDAADD